MLLNAYCVPVPGGLSTGGDVQGRGGHGQRHCWSQKESRQPRCPHVYGIGWNDCPSFSDYPLPTHFFIKMSFP